MKDEGMSDDDYSIRTSLHTLGNHIILPKKNSSNNRLLVRKENPKL